MKFFISLILYFQASLFILANGGGYHHGVHFTGSIAPFTAEGTEHIEIIHEDLDISLDYHKAQVTVCYQMKNTLNKAIKVKFGFPVEEVHIDHTYVHDYPQNKQPLIRYCTNYTVEKNGKNIGAEYQPEPFNTGKIKKFEGSEVLNGILGWMVTTLKVDKGETFTLKISYTSLYDHGSISVSDDVIHHSPLFKYRFSTGAIWKNSIKKGVVKIHFNDLDPTGITVIKPLNKFKKNKNSLLWEFENLNPTLKDDLNLQIRDSIKSYPAIYPTEENPHYENYINYRNKWFLSHAKYDITASSELVSTKGYNYGPNNLKGMINNGSLSWSEGIKGDGIGESLHISLKEPHPLAYIQIHNGYSINFENNNRVKQLELLINGNFKKTLSLPDINDYTLLATDYKQPVKTIKLTIKEIYKGKKFRDTCLSEISLLRPLKKAPKSYGAR